MSSQTPYIGSKISLISKLDIRYEGILYTVDTNDSTIALAKVKSFGTEDRPTANPVAARDDVYEYIIFKASDIKDLIVCETPKVQTMASGLPYDPAIISVTRSPPVANVMAAGDAKETTASSRSGTPSNSSPSFGVSRAPGAQRPPGRGGRGGYNADNRSPQHGRPNYQRGVYGHQGQRGQRNSSSGVPRPPKEKLKFDGDYDFEKANDQFSEIFKDKLKIDGEKSEEEEKPEQGEFYDKKSSFFDRISCEAQEKAEGKSGRVDWKKERETNQETFGLSAIRFHHYRRGYGNRGRGGNRGYQGQGYNNYGGRGGYSNNYRNGGFNNYRGGRPQYNNRDAQAQN